jgi:hypothetical protein
MGKTKRNNEANAATLQASQIQADAALQIAQLQSQANTQAAQLGYQGTLASVEGATLAAHLMAGATHHAAGLQFAAAENALALQEEQYNQSVERLAPYAEAGLEALPEVQRAATLEGFEARLNEMMSTDAFQELRGESQRQASGALGQSGLTRSGAAARAAADINIGSALTLDDRLYGRQMNSVAIGQSASAGQNYAGTNFANQSSAIGQRAASTAGNIIINGTGQQAGYVNQAGQYAAQGNYQQGQYLQQGAYYTGQGLQGAANAQASGILGVANNNQQHYQNRTNSYLAAAATVASFFSDERLKKNIKPIGKIGGLTLVEWDWIDEIEEFTGFEMSTGFIAQEVEKEYPQHVSEVGGVKIVHYPALQADLRASLNERVAA